MIERKYSKAKANGNHVVWTSREALFVPFSLDGLVYDGAEFGFFRVTGRDMVCTGFRFDFRVPSGDSNIEASVGLYTADSVLVGGLLAINGVTFGGDKVFTAPVAMPVGSLWKYRLSISSPDGDTRYFPQGAVATYHLRYASGPVNTKVFTTFQPEQGVGFGEVNASFIVG